MRSTLIKDTTREEREELIRQSLSFSDIGCEETSDGYDFYLPYIEGEVELKDLNMNYRAHYVKSDADYEDRGHSCMKGF